MNRQAVALTLVVLSLAVLAVPLSSVIASPHRMVKFQSYAELKGFLEDKTLSCVSPAITTASDGLIKAPGVTSTYSAESAAQGYSQTNNQVAGVDELDTVKTDGQYIYTISNNTLVIVKAYPATEASVVSRIAVNGDLEGVFVDGARLVLLTRGQNFIVPIYTDVTAVPAPAIGPGIAAPSYWGGWGSSNVTAWVFDISSRDSPELKRAVTVNGTMIGARLIGDYVYFITSQSVPRCYDEAPLPMMVMDGHVVEITAPEIYHSDLPDYGHTFTIVTALDAVDDSVEPTVQTFLIGANSAMYVSLSNLYVTAPALTYGDETVIHRIQIDGGSVVYQATGEVPGQILNQFSMDETNGYFRVATTTFGFSRLMVVSLQTTSGDVATTNSNPPQTGPGTNVYVLDLQLHTVGKLEGLAPTEQFHSARFLGDRAYLVTFKRIDPFFVVDLSNPDGPRVLGELKTPGFSDYLQPYDETHIIGIGRNTTNVDWENAVLSDGIKVSFYDVTDPTNPVESFSYIVGDRGSSSPALTDHKAVLFDHDRNLLVIPVEVAKISGDPSLWSYGTPVWQGAYVFKLSPQDGLVFRGGITHLLNGELPSYTNMERFVSRALYISEILYTISPAVVKVSSLTDLAEIGTVAL